MLITKLSKLDVMMISLDYQQKLPMLRRKIPNSKSFLMIWMLKETRRMPRELPNWWKRKNFKRLWMKPPIRDQRKQMDLKKREKNSNLCHPFLLKPEDYSLITSMLPHSCKLVKPKSFMYHHKSWLKWPNTSLKVPTKLVRWITSSHSQEPLSSSLNWLQELKVPKIMN
jgi:hypothetical protein